MEFQKKITAASRHNNSLLCVGLDPDLSKLPTHLDKSVSSIYEFNKNIVTATADLVNCFKLNTAFYEGFGEEGDRALKHSIEFIKNEYPDVGIILDAKRADIGNTNLGSVKLAYDYLEADAVTVNPYLGKEALEPFLERTDRGVIVLCRTSNSGAQELQDLQVEGRPLYQHVADRVANYWNDNNNCLLVVGATYPNELKQVRRIIGPEMIVLIPGIGAQGGNLEQTVLAGANDKGEAIIISVSRSVIYASSGTDYADAARIEAQQLRDQINVVRKKI
jgi:orotidine-5'-phosphate decarboxylase